jgi:hypothetical protein
MQVIYRISEAGYPKEKPDYINNKNCFENALKTFNKANWLVIADNVNEETKKYLNNKVKTVQYVSVGHGAGTFNLALDFALNINDPYEVIYFLENDYIHKPLSAKILEDGVLDMGFDYVTLYDHPDKYLNPIEGGNPFCNGRAEDTRLYLGEHCHFKLTNSTTMTFATKVKTLKEDENTLRKWTNDTHPYDFQMFMELKQKGKRLASAVPGFATHGETKWLSPLTDWKKQL